MSTSPQSFQRLRREKGLTSRQIAECAKVPLREEYLYEIGAPIDHETQCKILHAFCMLTGQCYQISDFDGLDEQPTLLLPKTPQKGFPSLPPQGKREHES